MPAVTPPRLAVLTSGGDAPGMNAAIRGVVRAADAIGITTYGVDHGYQGLIDGELRELDARAVSGILHQGGTVLGTARSMEFTTAQGRQTAAAALAAHQIDRLVVIGGDGSLRGAHLLAAESDIRVIGIPGTIDNDLSGTDTTLGFDTAVNTALESMDRIRDTAASHGRLFFIEVMGRHSGWIAVQSGLSGGATEVLVPEHDTDLDLLAKRVEASFDLGKRFCLVVVAEGHEPGVHDVASAVQDITGRENRVITLGHVQRGGSPTARDRALGGVMGSAAVRLIADGVSSVMVGVRGSATVHVPLASALNRTQPPESLWSLVRQLGR